MPYILILYYSRDGSTRALAQQVARGVQLSGDIEVRLRTVPEISSSDMPSAGAQEKDRGLLVTLDDLAQCAGLALGSPTRFGQMAAPLRHFFDQTSKLWIEGKLIDKPACVFTSTSTLHGGQEATLLNMMVPLLHHGMLLMGVPYSEEGLYDTKAGGTPYGATHLAKQRDQTAIDSTEQSIARAQGERLGRCALQLGVNRVN